ncbi:MAG: beta-lactamase family protein [Flavobacteriaceae bacterium]|nr:beta-lactamase family protein [Flavobacteriaceae bacterium]
MKSNKAVLVFFIPICCIFITVLIGCKQTELKTEIEDKLIAFMQPYVENRDFDGYIIIRKSDSILLSREFGKNASQLTENSQFMVGSITKTFTAEAISFLVKQGKISLSDPLTELVPSLPNASQILIKDLLVYSSGIRDYYSISEFNGIRNEVTQLKDFTKWISQFEPEFEPGERNSYSNSGYNLLAFIIESVSGLKYHDYLKTYIFNPLKMDSTGSFEMGKDTLLNIVQGFSPGSLPTLLSEPNKIHYSWLTGSGSVHSSPKDLLKWCSVIETRVIKEPDWKPYGWGLRSQNSIDYLEQSGRIPGYSSIIQIFPSLDLNIIVLNRIESDAVNSIAKGITNLLLNEDVEIPDIRKVQELSATKLSEYSGTYQFSPNFFVTFLEQNGTLKVATGKGENLDFSIVDYLGNDEFFFRSTYNHISFNRDKNDKINGINWAGSGPYPKVNQ